MSIKSIYKNRGMYLEKIINDVNTYYEKEDIAYIYKKPTPVKVLNVSYPKYSSHVIDKAVYERISTLDYNGIYKGRYIEFDAKECKSNTSLPLANIPSHQIKHIENIIRHGGIIFIILFMNSTFFLIKGEDLIKFIVSNTRKSIPYEYIEEHFNKIKESFAPRIDYLKLVYELYIREKEVNAIKD